MAYIGLLCAVLLFAIFLLLSFYSPGAKEPPLWMIWTAFIGFTVCIVSLIIVFVAFVAGRAAV